MQFSELQPFFKDNEAWLTGYEKYWYELMWGILKEDKALSEKMDENPQEANLLAVALVDLYRTFIYHAREESWDQYWLNIDELENYDYEAVCQLLGMPALTIHDFYSEEEILQEGWDEADFQSVLEEELPGFSEHYFTDARGQYLRKILQVIKQKYGLSDLFSLMVNTFDADRYDYDDYDYDRDEEDNEIDEDVEEIDESIKDVESFVSSAMRNQDHFLNDGYLMLGFSWLDRIY